jgi:hypothetical protein
MKIIPSGRNTLPQLIKDWSLIYFSVIMRACTTGAYPEPVKSISHLHRLFFWDPFYIVLPLIPYVSRLPPDVLSDRYLGCFPLWQNAREVKLTANFQLLSRLRKRWTIPTLHDVSMMWCLIKHRTALPIPSIASGCLHLGFSYQHFAWVSGFRHACYSSHPSVSWYSLPKRYTKIKNLEIITRLSD